MTLFVTVLVVSFLPVKRSHSVCAQGGINGAVNIKGEGDSPDIHFYDTVKGGDFLAHQPLYPTQFIQPEWAVMSTFYQYTAIN